MTVRPPSTTRVAPVTKEASSEARKITARPISSGTPMRPSSEAASSQSSLAPVPPVASVLIQPGETALARMPWGPPSAAWARVSASMPALATP